MNGFFYVFNGQFILHSKYLNILQSYNKFKNLGCWNKEAPYNVLKLFSKKRRHYNFSVI